MPWVSMPQIRGKVYIPDKTRGCRTKNPCPDCFACQHCSDERCRACRNEDPDGDTAMMTDSYVEK